MLAQFTKQLLAILVLASLAAGAVHAQQPLQPSQQYQPMRPANHVAPQEADRLQLQQARGQLAEQGLYPASATQRYSNNAQRVQPNAFPQGAVQQTSYQEQAVPQILAGDGESEARRAAAQQELAARAAQMRSTTPVGAAPGQLQQTGQFQPPQAPLSPQLTPPGENSMTGLRGLQTATVSPSAPRVDPVAIENHNRMAQQQIQQVAPKQAELKKAQNAFVDNVIQSMNPQSAQPQTTQPVATQPQTTRPVATQPVTTRPQQLPQPNNTAAVATQTTQSAPMRADALPTSLPTSTPAPVNQVRQVSQQEIVPPTMPNQPQSSVRSGIPSATMSSTTTPPTQINNTSQISLSAPAIEVKAFGPKTIGINKVSTFQVVVENKGNVEADKLIVGIDIPKWVDISNLNLTNGHKQLTDGVEQARLIWTVDRIPAGGQQTISIDTIARKAEVFDLGIEWTFAPRKGLTNVQVTEPRLEMNISGPQEVLYGETATYHVAVRNPGTGTAENVNVMLPEALGGERAPLGDIPAGQERNFQVELLARTAGELILAANASADAELSATAKREIMVRRGNLEVLIEGPGMKYAGGVGQYTITIQNTGDAIATDVVAAIALPPGVKYLSGAESANEIDGGLKWPVGSLAAGDQRTYKLNCQLDAAGNLQLEAGARANGDLAASSACVTAVETVADLVLTVTDPKGPLPTGQNVNYEIKVINRGSKSAKEVKLVMQFSEGIEPNAANGLQHRLVPGQVLFAPITQIDPGEELTFQVVAQAQKEGTHVFRAQLTCPDSDSREIAEGTTRFFGDDVSIPAPQQQQQQESTADNSESASDDTEIKR